MDEARVPEVLAELDPLIAAAVGGFPREGAGTVDPLSSEMGYGNLDGPCVAVVGHNGAGKSTLMNALAG